VAWTLGSTEGQQAEGYFPTGQTAREGWSFCPRRVPTLSA